MLIDYLKNTQANLIEQLNNFYTPGGIHVYVKDALINDDIDVEEIIGRIEDIVPVHLRSEIEMIIIGQFEEFEEQDISAFYRDGTLHITNAEPDTEGMFDKIIHELAHSVENVYGYEVYADQKIKDEFLRKRKYLDDMLWAKGYKAPLNFFMDVEYNKEFDEFLYKTVGYGKLSSISQGVFISAYAPTSLQEYFATGFLEFYLNDDHNFLRKTCPQLYKKLFLLQNEEKLDN